LFEFSEKNIIVVKIIYNFCHMPLNQYTLTEKKSLTSDVFELTFVSKDSFDFISGQFITFILPSI
jgi:ferredoxin-NADP reductase